MNISLPLIALRDLLDGYSSTAALNAARIFEQRQLYARYDQDILAKVIPTSLGQLIHAADPRGDILKVVFKRLTSADLSSLNPTNLSDSSDSGNDASPLAKWTPDLSYAVVYKSADYPSSAAAKVARVLADHERAEAARREELAALASSLDHLRRERMIQKIRQRVKIPYADLATVINSIKSESDLRLMISDLEKGLNITIYEELPEASIPQALRVPEANAGAGEAASADNQEAGETPSPTDHHSGESEPTVADTGTPECLT